MKTIKLTKKNVAKLLVEIQDTCDYRANALATKAVFQFGLVKEHSKLTGNPVVSYHNYYEEE